jgi:uncharacterized protein (TIGR04255 family)
MMDRTTWASPASFSDSRSVTQFVWKHVTPIRPKFHNPPLIERAISVAFKPLDGLSIGDYGLFWNEIQQEFPTSESMEPLALEIENFDDFRPIHEAVRFLPGSTVPRAAFRNSTNGELVQLQKDRFGFNWIKTSDDHRYPHSEATLKRFFDILGKFEDFIARRSLGTLEFIQCDITNVNIVLVSDVGESFADIATVIKFALLDTDYSNIQIENQLVGSKHLMLDDAGKPIGRVHTLGQPSLRVPSNESAFRLDICARGAPIGTGTQGVRKFLDVAVSAVNAAFLASTTKAGRRFWGEYDA